MKTDQPARTIADKELTTALQRRFGDRLSTDPSIREDHGRSMAYHPTEPPDAVFFARSAEEIAEVVKLCAHHRTPVIPFGAGTSMEGHVAARYGGVSIDLGQMDKIVAVHAGDLDVVVQPGVRRKQLNEFLRDTGLFFPLDPGADATIGGMAATRASGTNAVRYGTMREAVLSLQVVLADGSIIRTSGRARKSSAGYDLTRLFVGSEGTLGIITELTVRVFGIPDIIASAVCAFPTVADAVATAVMTMQAGVPIARMELMDELAVSAVNKYSKLNNAVAPTLFFEFHGTRSAVDEHAELVKRFAAENGGLDFQWSASPEERNKLWQARYDAMYAVTALRPGATTWPTDVCVPISRLAECITETRADIDQANLLAPIGGHVGDGNFHVGFVLDPNNPAEFAEAERINKRMISRALQMEGTCTGEHGIGFGKIASLEEEHGAAINVMRAVKRAIDQQGIMNPGKILRF